MRTRILYIAAATAIGIGGLGASSASANGSPLDAPFPHTHHVHTGNGECVDIDSVMFGVDTRGLHQGAHKSGLLYGPWHGTCEGLQYPGGDPLPPGVPHIHR